MREFHPTREHAENFRSVIVNARMMLDRRRRDCRRRYAVAKAMRSVTTDADVDRVLEIARLEQERDSLDEQSRIVERMARRFNHDVSGLEIRTIPMTNQCVHFWGATHRPKPYRSREKRLQTAHHL